MKKQKFVLRILVTSMFITCFFWIQGIQDKATKTENDITRTCFFSDQTITNLLTCFNTQDSDPFCMQTNTFFLTDRKSHNAPVQSVAWLCDSPIGTYAAIGGFPENNIVGSTDTRVYKFDEENGLLGDPINLVHGSYVFGVSWVYVFDPTQSIDYGAYLAVGGYPSSADDNEIHIFHLDSSTIPPSINPIPVASYKHGAPIKSVSSLGCGIDDTAYLAIGGQASEIDGAEIRVLKFKASDNSLTLLANRYHGATVNSVSWFYNPSSFPNFPPILAAGGDPAPAPSNAGPQYITIRVFTFNCAKESLQDLVFGSQPGPTPSAGAPPKRVFDIKPAIVNIDTNGSTALVFGVANESTLTSLNTYTPGFLLQFLAPGKSTKTTEASLEPVTGNGFPFTGISDLQVNGYAVDFNRSCDCYSLVTCCPQITFGLGCPSKDNSSPLPLNIFSTSFLTNENGTAYTKFDDNITSLEWCRTNNGEVSYLLVGSESNEWNLNSFCGGNEIAVYKALMVCTSQENPSVRNRFVFVGARPPPSI